MLSYTDKWVEELSLLSSIIQKTPLEKTTKWGSDVFTYDGKNVLSYGGFKNYFALWFYNGVFLQDKYHVLISAQEGITKSLRQWRFSSVAEIDERKILEYVNEAIAIEKMGLRIAPEKEKPVEIPQLFVEMLSEDKTLKESFDRLTPGKQKEYMLYIAEAKQEATKVKRLEKVRPMILLGIGLNDKYKK
jgi:uncharacterized protein YdeI (YjbR/CyaY-like superfamily)